MLPHCPALPSPFTVRPILVVTVYFGKIHDDDDDDDDE